MMLPFDPVRLPDGTALGARDQGCGPPLIAAEPNSAAALCVFDPQYRGVRDKMAHDNKDARQKSRGTLVQIDNATIASFITAHLLTSLTNPPDHDA